jgi:hypothetical protein
MFKVIAAFDGLKYSSATCEYAVEVARNTSSFLVGVFLDDKTYTSYKIYELVMEQGLSDQKLKKYKDRDQQLRHSSAHLFADTCKQSGIAFKLHHDTNIAVQDLLHETVFADLLIIDGSESFTHYEEVNPTRFIRDVLSNTQSPVLLVPHAFHKVEKVVVLYDGATPSVYAFKMFTYLMTNYAYLPLEVLCIKPMESNMHLPDNKLMKELVGRHSTQPIYTILHGLPEVEVINHLSKTKENVLVVMGAYRRTMLSRWFRSSLADAIVKELNVPLFIAHNK